MGNCKEEDIQASFTRHEVTVSCKRCNLKAELPSLLYHKKWGYPKGTETLSPFEWLHEIERRLGREMMERVKVQFRDTVNNVILGSITVPYGTITKLNLGDRIEFKETGAIFGLFEIQSFAINQGYPEGHVNLVPIKAKASIKLQETNEEYLDSLLPF